MYSSDMLSIWIAWSTLATPEQVLMGFYRLSSNAPRAGSYRPPGAGCRRVSKVVGLVILFTERHLISSDERYPKSTLPMEEATGFEIFMINHIIHVIHANI